VFDVRGWSKLWALRGRIAVPLASIRGVRRADPSVVRGWWKGLRLPGTHVPGVIVAGTFYDGSKRVFWDVRKPVQAIEVELAGAEYDRLVVDVADPDAAVERLRAERP
jgi:hypothetical protein